MAIHEYQKQMYKKIGVTAALIILPIVGFFTGVQYQKQTNAAAAATSSQNQFGARFGGTRGNRVIGTIKAISSNSITITSRLDNSEQPYTITSTTTYKNGTSDAQASDIKTGDTVLVSLDTSDQSKAQTITINPSFQRPAAQGNNALQ